MRDQPSEARSAALLDGSAICLFGSAGDPEAPARTSAAGCRNPASIGHKRPDTKPIMSKTRGALGAAL